MTVRIGGVAATNVVTTNNTTLTAVTPAGTAGARDIVLTNGWGLTTTRTGGFTYTSRHDVHRRRRTFTRYLAEGVETDQMSTQLALANPRTTDTQATLTFETSDRPADAGRRRRAGAVAPDGGPEHGAGAGRGSRSRRSSSPTSRWRSIAWCR